MPDFMNNRLLFRVCRRDGRSWLRDKVGILPNRNQERRLLLQRVSSPNKSEVIAGFSPCAERG
jgi:hypothetical protein